MKYSFFLLNAVRLTTQFLCTTFWVAFQFEHKCNMVIISNYSSKIHTFIFHKNKMERGRSKPPHHLLIYTPEQ